MPIQPDKVASTITKLKKEYVAQIKEKCAEIELLAPLQKIASLKIESLLKLTQIAHRFSSSGTTFGFPQLSAVGKSLELVLHTIIEEGEKALGSKITAQRLAQAITGVLESAHKAIDDYSEDHEFVITPDMAPQKKTILIAAPEGTDDILQLSEQLDFLGYNHEQMTDLADLKKYTDAYAPEALIIQTNFSAADKGNIQRYIEQCRSKNALPPIFYLSSKDDFRTRLAAVQHKGVAFSPLPLDHIQLIDQLGIALQHKSSHNYHILIIDDDEVLATRYGVTLESAGMTVTILTEPELLMDVLSKTTVDLILLDFHMPRCNGFELASILRQLNPFLTLPIIFLSTEVHLEQFMRSARLGIDEFLVKPIVSEKLIQAVTDRVERSLILRRFMAQDSATGLLNHTSLEKALCLEVARAARKKGLFTYAMLDIDHFKQINDSFGHATGDLVIRTLAHLLRKRLRYTDIIGRYGGEEFGVILPDTNSEQAFNVISDILKKFSEIAFPAHDETFHVTFSGGIAEYPKAPNELQLNYAADKALYKAKHQGRNQIYVAE